MAVLGFTSLTVQAQTLTLLPDQGAYWFPLGPNSSYVYANSFEASGGGTVTSLGTWLNTLVSDPGTALRFEILGSISGNPADGPDISDVLAETGLISGISGPLSLYSSLALGGSTPLIAGDEYWFAASAVGSSGVGQYQAGGHTQGTAGPDDNGSFWFSNDPSGNSFVGQNFQPEMAFTVSITPSTANIGSVPDGGSTAGLLGGAFMAMAWLRRKIGS
jgi:hypothetical protein